MEKLIKIPVWLLLLIFICCALSIVGFGYVVQKAAIESKKVQPLNTKQKVALNIAQFPSTIQKVFTDIWVNNVEIDRYTTVTPPKQGQTNFIKVGSQIPELANSFVINDSHNDKEVAKGWRVLVGVFNYKGKMTHGAVLLSPELEIVHSWVLDDRAAGEERAENISRKVVHGFDMLPDGSALYVFEWGRSIQKVDICGNQEWKVEGTYHHSITLTENTQSAWSIRKNATTPVMDIFDELNTSTGEILRSFSLQDILDANPDLKGIFNIKFVHYDRGEDNEQNRRNETRIWERDPFHVNDVDPLPKSLADQFRDFNEGDLLISLRNINLVMVASPETLKIKWWRIGATQHQHDPDWADGYITVLDNRMGEKYSTITKIDPENMKAEVIHNGAENDFYTRFRGKHQRLPNRNIMVTSSQQGEIFEVNDEGKTVLRIQSRIPGEENKAYVLTQAIFIPTDEFHALPKKEECAGSI